MVWTEDDTAEGSSTSIYGMFLDKDGNALSDTFLIAEGEGSVSEPTVAVGMTELFDQLDVTSFDEPLSE